VNDQRERVGASAVDAFFDVTNPKEAGHGRKLRFRAQQLEVVIGPAGQTPWRDGTTIWPCRASQRGIAHRVIRARDAAGGTASLEGEQSPWKYRVFVARNGGGHYGLVGGAKPRSRSTATRCFE